MISIYNLTDATSAALFGMFALWAASSRWHWFVRTAVVGGALLGALLIPAWEVLAEYGLGVLLVVVGMAAWRRRRRALSSDPAAAPPPRFRLQLSLATLLLVVVIVAVATAVAARAPRLALFEWYRLTVVGLTTAAVALTCVWIVCGRARWWVRLLISPLLAIALGASMQGLTWAGSFVRYWYIAPGGSWMDYAEASWRNIWPGLTYWTTNIGLGMAILCVWLFLLRQAGWFDPFDESRSAKAEARGHPRRVAIARAATVMVTCLIFALPLALFYRLMTPTPIPAVTLPDPNGFDDFIAAGRMIGPTAAATLTNWDQLSEQALAAELAKHAAAFDRMREGLQKPCGHPYAFKPWTVEDARALRHLVDALKGQAELARRRRNLDMEVATYVDILRLVHAESRGNTTEPHVLGHHYESGCHELIWHCRTQFNAKQCAELVAELWELEVHRELWEARVERQRIVDENRSWQVHLHVILADWSGQERYARERVEDLRCVAELRTLIVELAIRAYQLDTGTLPATLEKLVPRYLPASPAEEFGPETIQLVASGDGYTLFCLSPPSSARGDEPFQLLKLPADTIFPPPVANQPAPGGSQAANATGRDQPDGSDEAKAENPPAESDP